MTRRQSIQLWVVYGVLCSVLLSPVSWSQTTQARTQSVAPAYYQLDIPQQALATALRDFARQTGIQLLFPHSLVENLQSQTLAGQFTLDAALKQMLKGSGLSGGLTESGVIVITPEQNGANSGQGDKTMHTMSKKKLLSQIMGFFIAGNSVAAVAENEVDGFLLEEVVVTAQKREQNVKEVPFSVGVLGAQELERRGIGNLTDLSITVPGLLVQDSGTATRKVSIRGIGNTFGGSSLVGLYVDEVPVTASPNSQLDLQIYDLERVEVLKGPQGTLYGEGSTGGTIRFITKDPSMDGFAAGTDITLAFTKDGDPSEKVQGMVNLPVGDSLALRVAGTYANTGGWVDQPALDKTDINHQELYNLRTKALWQPTDSLQVKAMAIVHRAKGGSGTIGVDDDSNYTQAFLDPSTPSKPQDDYDIYNLTIDYDLSGMSLLSSTSYMELDKHFQNMGYRCCFPTVDDSYYNVFGPDVRFSGEVFTQELRLSSDGSGPLTWTVGGFFRDAELNPWNWPNPDSLFGDPNDSDTLVNFTVYDEQTSESWAVFGEAEYALTEQFTAGLGLRYFEDDRTFQSDPTGVQEEQSDTFDTVNPKFFISYAATDEINIYANASKGFRSGGFNSAGFPSYDPESVWSYEIGTKGYLLDGRIDMEFAYFYSEYEDYQIVGVVPGIVANITSNAGNARITGVDFLLAFQATENIELGINGNHMHTEFVEISADSSSHIEGDPIDLVPKYGFTVWGGYSVDFEAGKAFARLEYNEQGKSHFRNRSFGDDYRSTSDEINMLNARVGWENDQWNVELFAQNLLDDRGHTDPFVLERFAARATPLTVGIQLGYDFY